MPDFLNFGNRLRNIFAPKDHPILEGGYNRPIIMDDPRRGGISGNLPRVNWGGYDPEKMKRDALSNNGGMLDDIYSPEHEYSDRYKNVLDQMPTRTEPGMLRRIFGAMAGLGENGMEAQERTKYAPYYRQLGDWQEKMKALQPGMVAERGENVNERMMAQNILLDKSRNRQNDIREEDLERKKKLDDANVKIRQDRAEAYANNLTFKQQHPKHELAEDENGDLYWLDPTNPTATPVKTGLSKMGEIEKINLNQGNALKRIAATGAQSRLTEAQRSGHETEHIEQRGEQARSTKAAPSDTGSTTETTTTVTDAEGKPVGTRKTTAKKIPGTPSKEKLHRMQYKDKNTGKMLTVRVPESKVREAVQHGAQDLGVLP